MNKNPVSASITYKLKHSGERQPETLKRAQGDHLFNDVVVIAEGEMHAVLWVFQERRTDACL